MSKRDNAGRQLHIDVLFGRQRQESGDGESSRAGPSDQPSPEQLFGCLRQVSGNYACDQAVA
jgi:hypothetical protein